MAAFTMQGAVLSFKSPLERNLISPRLLVAAVADLREIDTVTSRRTR
jgi:hypothetical protein